MLTSIDLEMPAYPHPPISLVMTIYLCYRFYQDVVLSWETLALCDNLASIPVNLENKLAVRDDSRS